MHFPRRRWRLAFMAVLAALAVSVTVVGPAFAAEPGEDGSWSQEYVGGQPLRVNGHMTEARNAGHLLQVWRGETNNNVWMSLDNGNPFTLGTTATYVSPTVVPFGPSSFMVLHTGTNGNMYYTYVYSNGGWANNWWAIPNQSTNNAVSAAQVGTSNGGTTILVLYRGNGNDNVYSTAYISDAGGWQSAEIVAGGQTEAAPSVTYNAYSNQVFAVIRGEDNQIWMNSISNGQWGNWAGQGFYTYTPPIIRANGNTGHMLVSAIDENSYRPTYRAYTSNGVPMPGTGWSQDITGWQTVRAVAISVLGYSIYAILTGLDGNVYYKQAYWG